MIRSIKHVLKKANIKFDYYDILKYISIHQYGNPYIIPSRPNNLSRYNSLQYLTAECETYNRCTGFVLFLCRFRTHSPQSQLLLNRLFLFKYLHLEYPQLTSDVSRVNYSRVI